MRLHEFSTYRISQATRSSAANARKTSNLYITYKCNYGNMHFDITKWADAHRDDCVYDEHGRIFVRACLFASELSTRSSKLRRVNKTSAIVITKSKFSDDRQRGRTNEFVITFRCYQSTHSRPRSANNPFLFFCLICLPRFSIFIKDLSRQIQREQIWSKRCFRSFWKCPAG